MLAWEHVELSCQKGKVAYAAFLKRSDDGKSVYCQRSVQGCEVLLFATRCLLHSPATQLTNVQANILCTPRCFVHVCFEFFDVDIIFFQSRTNLILGKSIVSDICFKLENLNTMVISSCYAHTLKSSIRTKSGKKGKMSSIFNRSLCLRNSMALNRKEKNVSEKLLLASLAMRVTVISAITFLYPSSPEQHVWQCSTTVSSSKHHLPQVCLR